jgi:hypothetical protein
MLEELKPYMLDETICKVKEMKTTEIKKIKEDKIKEDKVKEDKVKEYKVKEDKVKEDKVKDLPITTKSSFFYPAQKDQLFWCFYILKYGFQQYEYPGNTSYVNEKQEKFTCIENIRLHKQILKDNKIKNKEDIEDDLANKSTITQKTFIALCYIEKLNVLYIYNNKYYEINSGSTNNFHVVHCINNKYCYETDTTQEQINTYKSSLYKCDNIDKPLKAISYYKLNELVDICICLKVSGELHKKKKQDLYQLLLEKL